MRSRCPPPSAPTALYSNRCTSHAFSTWRVSIATMHGRMDSPSSAGRRLFFRRARRGDGHEPEGPRELAVVEPSADVA